MIECSDKSFRLLTDHTAYLFRVTPFGHLWRTWPSSGAAWARGIFGTRPRS